MMRKQRGVLLSFFLSVRTMYFGGFDGRVGGAGRDAAGGRVRAGWLHFEPGAHDERPQRLPRTRAGG